MSTGTRQWAEGDIVMVSALQHWSYCPRQCALIHVEQAWDENLYTLRGRHVHNQVDTPGGELVYGVRVERAMPIWSDALGLVGRADVVEFLADGTPLPVEYKHGPRRVSRHDDLQLAAQAICLEEMFGKTVPRGFVFHHASRRRREVHFTAASRTAVVEATAAVRAMLRSGRLPNAVNDKRCDKCSLRQSCLPTATDRPDRAARMMRSLFVVSEPEEPCINS